MSEEKKTYKIKAVQINNLMALGVQGNTLELNFDGNINLLKGSNEEGKSRFVKLMELTFSKRLKTDWVRTDNKEPGSMIIQFDDGSKIVLEATQSGISRKAYTPENIVDEELTKLLRSDIMEKVLNAAKFLDDDSKEYRRQAAIAFLDPQMNEDKFNKKIGETVPGIDYSNVLDIIKESKKYYEPKRAAMGNLANEAKTLADNAEQSLKDVDLDIDYAKELLDVNDKFNKLSEEKNRRSQKIRDEIGQKKSALEIKKDELRETTRAKIAELEKQIQDIKNDAIKKANEIDLEKSQLDTEIERQINQASQDIDREISVLKGKQENFQQLSNLQLTAKAQNENAKQNRKKEKEYKDKWNYYDSCLKNLKTWENKMFSTLAIEGLTIEDDLMMNGKPFKVWNDAKKVDVFSKLIMDSVQEFRFVCLDNFERIGRKIRETLFAKLQEKDIQGIFTQLVIEDGHTLTVEKE